MKKFLQLYEAEQLDEEADIILSGARECRQIGRKLWERHTPIPTNDLWIAAIARALKLILVTNDNHFKHIKGLQREDWTKLPDDQTASKQPPDNSS